MKKLLMLSVAAFALSTLPAMANEHEGGDGHKGKMFEKHDTNGDGVITQEEFLAHAQEKFAKLDADGDGSVTKAEMDAKKKEWREKMKEKRAENQDSSDDTVDESAE